MKKILAAILAVLLIMSMATVSIADDAEPVSLEFFVLYPWVTNELPDPEIDIYKKFFDDNFGIDMKLINSADGDTELLSRFTAGNAPDVIQLGGFNNLMKYYEQGVLIDDWTPYIDQLPHFLEAMGEEQQHFFTRDDKLIGLGVGAGGQQYGWMIRKDWLANLGLAMPTNLDELYDVLYAFTYNDPDGDGEANTYGITSAGGGSGIGELAQLIYLLGGRDDWYVAEDGSVSHPVLDGTYKELAEFIKKCYDGGVLDPNWYTQGWEERKSMLFAGSFGMCWYPPKALLEENYAAREDEEAMNWWTVMPLFDGCAYGAQGFIGDSVLSVSMDCAADEAKMAKVVEIFDTMNPCAEDDSKYLAIVHGVDFDGYSMTRLDGGTKYMWKDVEKFPYIMRSSAEGSYIACAVYAQLFRATGFDQVETGSAPEADPYFLNKMNEFNTLMSFDRASAESKYLTIDATLSEETSMAWNEFVLNYILGVDDDYDAFVENWKIAGGDEMLESVTEQFTEWGFIG